MRARMHDDCDRNLLPRREIRVAAHRAYTSESEMHVICDPSIPLVPGAPGRAPSRTYGTDSRTVERNGAWTGRPPLLLSSRLSHFLHLPDFAAIFFSLSWTIPLVRFLPPANTFSSFSNPTSRRRSSRRGGGTQPLSSDKARRTRRRNARIKSLMHLG